MDDYNVFHGVNVYYPSVIKVVSIKKCYLGRVVPKVDLSTQAGLKDFINKLSDI